MGIRVYSHHLYLQGNRCRGRKAEARPYTFHKILRCGIIEHRDRPPVMYRITELKINKPRLRQGTPSNTNLT